MGDQQDKNWADAFRCLFEPRAAAIVGSTGEGKVAYHLIRQALAGGYRNLYAVNPKAQGLEGVPAYPSVAALPEPIDVAVIASPAPSVADVLEECGRAGVGAAVIITAGFSEAGNHAGEQQLKEIGRRYGIRLVGPNCAGLMNTATGFTPSMEVIPPPGVTALISQSGALAGAVLGWAEEQGLGFSKFVSYGNRADLTEAEFLRYIAHDPETRCVALYIESVADGREFMAALAECTAQKPVVVIKAGRSSIGQRATLSHTGSMAGADTVYDAALKACGAIRARSIEEMFDLCKGFTALPPVHGKRIAVVTNSGGPGVLAADQAEDVGLALPEPSPALRAELSSFLPSYCALRNPIDLTVEGTEDGYRETLVRVLGGDEYDAALALNVAPAYQDSESLARGIHDAALRTGKPVVVNFMSGRPVAPGIHYLRERGSPVYPSGERAMTVLARMAEYCAYTARDPLPSQREQAPLPPHTCPATQERERGRRLAKPIGGGGHLPTLEPDIMRWLGDNDLPTPPMAIATSADEAAREAARLGYPVVMKVVSPDILHKSDCGGVVLNIDGDAAARRAFESIRQAAAGKEFCGAVIYPMVRGAQEVIVGIARDPQFGPVVMFGLGGIYTEILRDVALRVAPVGEAAASSMIREVRTAPLLFGARGRAPLDVAGLARLIAGLSTLPFRYPHVRELDLNPVFVMPEGVVIGDARVIGD